MIILGVNYEQENRRLIYECTRILITEFVNRGYSKEYLRVIVDDFFFNPNNIIECSIDTIIRFLDGFNFKEKDFKFVFGINDKSSILFENIEISNIADGTYTGYANTSFLKVKLELIVQNGTLQNVKILMNEGSVGQNVAPITQAMIKENKIIVSPIPDEEIASVVFMSAATNALSSQNQK